MGINDLPTGDDQRSQFRRPGFLAAIAFLALVVVLAVVVVVSSGGGKSTKPVAGPSKADGQQTSGGQSTATSSPGSTGNACGLTDTSQTVPSATPPNIKWELFAGAAVPSAPAAGPGKVNGYVASCYAHTPLGALLAVSQIGQRLGVANNAQSAEILKQQAVPGPGLDHDLGVLSSGAQVNDGTPEAQLAGFQFASYSGDTAVINLVDKATDGSYSTATFTARWLGGDWKIQLQDNGADSSTVAQVNGLSGYAAWSGVS
ncbi:hypothetical protein [Streptantibioticus ferralitis]|uniref:DUF8175 domain-containing protein n=1 Tax=Streptantibioticus ferralitis TaxID=236510 RepID=A0ABT5Z8V0_9ACTN|nr:hypothetical protein [Streptantibioticus ferralitis]MDF2259485.1 hypothetical protein [Streptantibioticus ferralitis]